MYMHLTERGKLAKPLDIYTNGVKKKIKHSFVRIKVKQARVLQPDPRSSTTHYYTRDLQTKALQKNVISTLSYTFLASLNV